MLSTMRLYGKGLVQGLKSEWDAYGKVGQKILVSGGVAIAIGLGYTFSATEPKCPTHPLVGVGNPEFRCHIPQAN